MQITDPTNTTLNSGAVTSAIAKADAVIDSYATGTGGATGTAGALWSTTPTAANQAAIIIAVYTLYLRLWDSVPAEWVGEYERVIEQLVDLSKGRVSWVASEDPPQQNIGRVFYFTSDSTNRATTPNRRTTRGALDKL